MIEYKKLTAADILPELFAHFDRRQEVNRCWRREGGEWVLKPVPFIDDWSVGEYEKLAGCLRSTVETGGAVWGAYIGGRLLGFASLESEAFGSAGQYRQLSSLHVSREQRGNGMGRELFHRIVHDAGAMGAKKLYISAHSSEETQAFYKAVGCVEAEEINRRLFDAEPFDCHLEYIL